MRHLRYSLISITLLAIFTLFSTLAVHADEVLVKGDPPLRQTDVENSIAFLEFLFEIRLSFEQRGQIKQSVERAWRGNDEQTKKDVAGLVMMNTRIMGLDPEGRASIRSRSLPIVLQVFKDNSGRAFHSCVLSVYRESKIGAAVSPNTESTVTLGSKVSVIKANGSLSDLVGKWERKQSGQSYVRKNGTYAGGSGNFETYTFYSDGRVEYSTLIAVQNYGCRFDAFAINTGRAGLDGGRLEIHFDGGTVRRDDSCSPGKNYSRPLAASSTTYDWLIENDAHGNILLVLTQPNGETFYYRRVR